MRFSMPRYVWIVSLCAAICVAAGAWVYRSTQRPPRFYAEALSVPLEAYQQAGDSLEQSLLQLSNEMRLGEGGWHTTLSQAEINGWIATDLPEKFPDALPGVIRQPRIAISEKQLDLAFRVQSTRFTGIVHVSGDIFCTGQLNQIAVRILRVRTGMVVVPIRFWAEQIQQSLEKQGIVLTWADQQGDPVALIDLPKRFTRRSNQQFSIEAIVLVDGALQVTGTTHDFDKPSKKVVQTSNDNLQHR